MADVAIVCVAESGNLRWQFVGGRKKMWENRSCAGGTRSAGGPAYGQVVSESCCSLRTRGGASPLRV